MCFFFLSFLLYDHGDGVAACVLCQTSVIENCFVFQNFFICFLTLLCVALFQSLRSIFIIISLNYLCITDLCFMLQHKIMINTHECTFSLYNFLFTKLFVVQRDTFVVKNDGKVVASQFNSQQLMIYLGSNNKKELFFQFITFHFLPL